MNPVVEAVARQLRAGLELEAESLEAVLAALGEDDPAHALDRLAADPEACEHAPLVALLFSPGASAMRALEPALAAADLDAAGAAALAEAVAARLGGTRLPVLLPGGARCSFPAAAEDVRGYVRRLRPAATPPAGLRSLLAQRFASEPDPGLAAQLAVLLRHSRLAWTPEQVFFVAALLERANPAADDLPGLSAWAAAFLGLSGLPFDPRAALALRRQTLLDQLRQAEAAERALAQGSFETRLAQGLRLGHVHGPDARRELGFLDRACRLALGVPGATLADGGMADGGGGVAVRDLGEAADLEELLRLLP